jgi:hypothetical protein
MTVTKITGNMSAPNGKTILTGSLFAVSSARSNRFCRISSLKTRKASLTSVPSSND